MLGGPYRPAASLGEHIGLRAGTPLAAPLAAGVVGAELIRMRQIASGIDFTGASDEDVMRMPARYTERQAAGRGAVARYYQGRRG